MAKEVKEEELKDGAILENRSCTDVFCILFFALFLIGWIVVIAVAFAKGRPEYIVKPTNYNGVLCGGDVLTDYPVYYVPVPTLYTYGFCVKSCPSIMDYVCNNEFEAMVGNSSQVVVNGYYSHTSTEYFAGATLAAKCKISTCTTAENVQLERYYGLILKTQQQKCFPAVYTSGSTLYRCIPFASDKQNATLMSQLNASVGELSTLADNWGASAFFTRGFSECQDSWLVILICCLSCAVFSMLWIFLLRWILAPLVYFVIIAVFALLVGVGYLAYRMYDSFSTSTIPGDTGASDQVILWKALMYGAWILAAIYVVLMLWLINRIRIAITVMEESSRAFLANPGMIVIPPITAIVVLGLIALFVAVTLYIQTIGSLQVSDFQSAAVSVFGAAAVNLTEQASGTVYASLTNANTSTNVSSGNSTSFSTSTGIKGLHAYNFFMFLWSFNFVIAWGFMIMALVICTWYFSATAIEVDQFENGVEGGRQKGTNAGTLCRSICATMRYHLGTLFFGSLLIAIIQFIRAVMLYIEKNFLDKYKDNATIKVVIWCINCWLACIERIIKIISYNAFIISCIKCQNFLSSAVDALSLLTSNILRVSMLAFLSTAACFLIKLFICCSNMILAYFLINQSSLTNNVKIESGLFPLFFILLISFAICSLFVNVYEVCIDTILMCFFVDEAELKGMFMPPSLAKLIGMFTQIAEARKKYDEMVKEANKKAAVEM